MPVLHWQKGFAIPSSAAFGKIGDAYVAEVHRWAKAERDPGAPLHQGENKEEIARPLIEAAERDGGDGQGGADRDRAGEGIGVAIVEAKGQEKAGAPHMEWGRQMAFVNHFYFYLWDPEWGGGVLEDQRLRAVPMWLWLNGHEWAKRQLEKAGIGYEALDNGFRGCDDPQALQKICDRLGPGAVQSFFWRW